MWSKKEIIIFVAGAQTFHTLTHILINFTGTLPIKFFFINWTWGLNFIGIIVNILITIVLFTWIYNYE